MDLQQLEKLEEQNIKRASKLVVNLQRDLKRTYNDLEKKDQEVIAEQKRHTEAMDLIRQEAAKISQVLEAIKVELEESEQYLKQLTLEQAKPEK